MLISWPQITLKYAMHQAPKQHTLTRLKKAILSTITRFTKVMDIDGFNMLETVETSFICLIESLEAGRKIGEHFIVLAQDQNQLLNQKNLLTKWLKKSLQVNMAQDTQI